MNAKKPGNDQWVETLLAANPVDLADDGFSKRVLANIKRQERQRLLILAPFFVGAFALFLGFFPYELFEGLAGSVSSSYKNLGPYLVPFLAVIGVFMFSMFSEEVA
ncbi:MAG: hypothetical protein ACTSU8_03240 [Alphaproteobacteria bacterium]